MNNSLILLSEQQIQKHITYQGKYKIGKIEILNSIPSTSDYLKKCQTLNDPFTINICLAEHQSAGRGTSGRVWHSPFASNIYFSCSWQLDKDISRLNGLSLAVALAVVETLRACGIEDGIAIKWPNDVFWRDKKLAGILLEICPGNHSNKQMIIGIGLNVNMANVTAENINRAWTSLQKISGTYHNRNNIAGLLISHLLQAVEMFEQQGLTGFINIWQNYDYLSGRKITLSVAGNKIEGIAAGINEQGQLLLKHADGKITAHSAGDVSIVSF